MPASRKRIAVELPIKAISTNKLYSGKKVRSWFYKKYRKEVFQFLDSNANFKADMTGNLVVDLEVGFSSPLSDCSNAIKGIEDCIAEYYGFNDRQVVSVHIDKYLVSKGYEYTKIIVRRTKKNIDRRIKYVKPRRSSK